MGQDQSNPDSLTSIPASPTGSKRDGLLDPEEARRQIQRAKLRIRAFHARAGTEEICSHLFSSWTAEKPRVTKTWSSLSDSARRGLIMNIREKVVQRARLLHTVIAPRQMTLANKSRLVRKLMEKVAIELFDTSIVYDAVELPKLVEAVLENRGGGSEIPFGLMLEVDTTFQPDVRRFSMLSLASKDGSGMEDGSLEVEEDVVQQQLASEGIAVEPSIALKSNLVTSRSANSLQGYYSSDQKKNARRNSGSKSIHRLLSFIPSSGIDPISRKNLTLELLLEMRDAFLVHFAVLVFSELFDESDKVVHKYEYDSDTDTDVGHTDTDLEEIEEEEGESSSGDSS